MLRLLLQVLLEPQPRTAPKKSWQQLFTRSTTAPAPPPSTGNVISRPNGKSQTEVQSSQLSSHSSTIQHFDNPISFGLPSSQLSSHSSTIQHFDNPISFGLPSLFNLPNFPNGSTGCSSGFSPAIDPLFPRVGEGTHEFISEDPELFEDPCYVPDPVSLLGPVSESLDNFQLDLGAGFVPDAGLERNRALKNVHASAEVNRPSPSPIVSPLSRLRLGDDRHGNSNRFPSTPKTQDMHSIPMEDLSNANEKGTWQMWNSSPLGQDHLGLVGGGSSSWLLPPELNRSNKDDIVNPSSLKPLISLFTKEDQLLSGSPPQKVFLGNCQNGGTFSSPVSGSNDHDPWLHKTFYQPLSGNESHFSLNHQETPQKEIIYGSPGSSSINHPFELSSSTCWSK